VKYEVRFKEKGLNDDKTVLGSPVKFATLVFCEEFNGASKVHLVEYVYWVY
jgi:hypothetical protein